MVVSSVNCSVLVYLKSFSFLSLFENTVWHATMLSRSSPTHRRAGQGLWPDIHSITEDSLLSAPPQQKLWAFTASENPLVSWHQSHSRVTVRADYTHHMTGVNSY